MNKFHFILGLAVWLLIGSCKTAKDTAADSSDPRRVALDEILVKPAHLGYQETETKAFDLIHTILEVSFDYEKHICLAKPK